MLSHFVVEGVKLVYIAPGGEEPCSWFPLNFAHVPFPFVDIVLIFFLLLEIIAMGRIIC